MRDQPLGQVRGGVVAVQLPLDLHAAVVEVVTLAGDQHVERDAVDPAQVAVGDEAAPIETDHPDERPVALDGHPGRKPVGHVGAQLGVVRGTQEQCRRIRHCYRLLVPTNG